MSSVLSSHLPCDHDSVIFPNTPPCHFSPLPCSSLPRSPVSPWLIFTAPSPQPHWLKHFYRFPAASACWPKPIQYPNTNLPPQHSERQLKDFKANPFKLPPTYPISKEPSGRLGNVFHTSFFSKPPFFQLLLKSLKRTCATERCWQLSCCHNLRSPCLLFALRSLPARATALIHLACKQLDAKTLQSIVHW